MRRSSRLAAFKLDQRGASAIEFAIVSMPFMFTMLVIFQMGIFYMAQTSLDAGVIAEADTLTRAANQVNPNAVPPVTWTDPTAAALKTAVVSKSGGLIKNDSTLNVELIKFSTLKTGAPAIGNTVSTASGEVLALRAESKVVTLFPAFFTNAIGSFAVRSTALVRRP